MKKHLISVRIYWYGMKILERLFMKKTVLLLAAFSLLSCLLCGCGASGQDKTYDLDQVAAAISAAAPVPYPADMDDEYLTGMYGIDPADVEEYRGQYSNTNTFTDELLLVRAAEGKADAVREACEARRAAKQEQAAMYDEVQAQKAQNGRVVVRGDYVIFVVAGDDGRIADGEVNEIYQEIDKAIEDALA